MTNFLLEKFDNLTQIEREKLSRNIRKTSSNGQKILAQAATLVVEESKKSLTKIENTTNEIKRILTMSYLCKRHSRGQRMRRVGGGNGDGDGNRDRRRG